MTRGFAHNPDIVQVLEEAKLVSLRERYITAKLEWLNEVQKAQRHCTHKNIVEHGHRTGETVRLCLDCCMSENSSHIWTFLLWQIPQDVPVIVPPQVPLEWIYRRRAGLIFCYDEDRNGVDPTHAAIKSGKLTQMQVVDTYFKDNKLLERSSH